MARIRIGEDEVVRADVSAPAHTLLFPFLELVVITALCWAAIGWLDNPQVVTEFHYWDFDVRNTLVGLWAVLAAWRFGVPLLKARYQRFIITDQRIVARPARFGSAITSIPLHHIARVHKSRGGLVMDIHGQPRSLYFENIAKARKLERMLQ